MRFFYKTILFVLLFFVFLILGVNIYLRSSGLKEKIRSEAQLASGMAVQVENISFMPWSGLSLEKIMIENPSNRKAFTISSISIPILTIVRLARNSGDWSGQITLKKVAMNNRVLVENIAATLVRKGTAFNITPFSARLLKGKLQGSLLVPNIKTGAYQLNAQFSEIPLKECLAGTGFEKRINAGALQGRVFYSGTPGDSRSQGGSGTLEIVATEIQAVGMMGGVGAFLPLEELQVLKLQEAKADFKITPEQVLINSLKLHSQNLILTGSGELSYQGIWNLNAQLLLNASLQKQLQSLVPVTLEPSSEPGYQQIAFKANGSTTNLQSDLLNKLMMKQVTKEMNGVIQNQVGGALQNILNNTQKHAPNVPVNIPIPLPLGR